MNKTKKTKKTKIDTKLFLDDLKKDLREAREQYEKNCRDIRSTHRGRLLQLIETEYQDFGWRGGASFREIRYYDARLFADGVDECHTIYLTNEGFEFSGEHHKHIALRALSKLNIEFLIALINYMQTF